MARTVIRRLAAWGAPEGVVTLEPGAVVESCRIHRNPVADGEHAAEVYVMTFVYGGRPLRCPLVEFQARTQALAVGAPGEATAREAATIS